MKLAFARLNQEISGLEVELLGEEGLLYDDWTMRRPELRRLHRPRRRLPLPARQGQLHRGRHLRDPAATSSPNACSACPPSRATTRTSPGRTCPMTTTSPTRPICSTPRPRTTCAPPYGRCSPTARPARRGARPRRVRHAVRPRAVARARRRDRRGRTARAREARRAGREPPRGRRGAGGAGPRRRARAVPDQRRRRDRRRCSRCDTGTDRSPGCSASWPRAAGIAVLAVPLATAPARRRPAVAGRRRPSTGTVTGVADAAGRRCPARARRPTGCTRSGGRRRRHRRAAGPARPDPAARRPSPSTARPAPASPDARRGRAAVAAGCSPGPDCSPPSSSASPSGAWTETVGYTRGAPPVQPAGRLVPGAQAPAGRSSGWRSSRPAPPPGTRPTRSPTGSPDAAVAVAVAQAYCSPVAVHAAEECVQLHGGIGMTWEHPAHLYLKRAKADAIAYGTAGRHREALAELVDLPAPVTDRPAHRRR